MTIRVVPILAGVKWDPNAPEEMFAVDEDRFAALVLRPHPDDSDESSVVIFWSGVEDATFGLPNDEGRHQHPLHGAGLAGVLWTGEVVGDETDPPTVRHFIVPTKEGLAEVHAQKISWARLAGVTDAHDAIDRLKPYFGETQTHPEAIVDGFTLGMFVSYDDCGDAWVRAPDGGLATLIWESGVPAYFQVVIPPDPAGRWGTYAVQVDLPLTTDAEAEAFLRALLPELKPRWDAWAQTR
jgi:hypothetical protein